MPALAFLALAFFSCNWTANSFYVWQPDMTLPGAWFLAIVFYVIASICFSLIWKAYRGNNVSFRSKIMSRGTTLLMCIVGFLVFCMFSLLTNTHYLIYKSEIKKVATDELNSAKYYLNDIAEGGCERCRQRVQTKAADFKNCIDNALSRLLNELSNPGNEGAGPRFTMILDETELNLKKILRELDPDADPGFIIIQKINHGATWKQWKLAYENYKNQFESMKTQLDAIVVPAALQKCQKLNDDSYNDLIADIDVRLSDMSSKTVGYKIMEIVNNDLLQGYSVIAEHANLLSFKDNDKEKYTETNAQPKTIKLAQVPTVWSDYLSGKYNGHGFLWRILLSILVDLSTFIFFNIAFNHKNNNLKLF